MVATATGRYTYETLHLPRWEVDIPVAREGNIHWFPARYMCEKVLGVNWSGQLEVLKSDSRFRDVIREVPFNIGEQLHLDKKGWRMPVAIPRPEIALWIVGIDPARCAITARGTLDELQRDIMLMSDRHIFQPRNNVVLPEEARGVLYHANRMELTFACEDCGAFHRIIIEDGDVIVSRK